MTNGFYSSWIDVALEQMWIYRQGPEVVAKCIDTDLLLDPQAATDYCLNPTEPRLNPLEFHGARRSAAPRRPTSGAAPAAAELRDDAR